MLKGLFTLLNKDKIVLNQAKRNKEVVFGARALTKQLRPLQARPTQDWDLLSKKPKKSARQLERTLDRRSGADIYYTKPALHPNTTKVMHKGFDMKRGTRDDFGIADYSKQPKGLKTINIKGISFATLKWMLMQKKQTLKDPEAAFRRGKDISDLGRIKNELSIRGFFRKLRRI